METGMRRGGRFLLIASTAMCLLAIACLQQQPQSFRRLTERETEQVIAEERLTPVMITSRKDTTHIFFQNTTECGHYSASKRQDGERVVSASTTSCDDTKIASVGVVTTGDSFAEIMIHDPATAQKVETAVVRFEDGSVARVETNGKRAVAVFDPSAASGVRSVTLLAASGDDVYREDFE